MVSGGGLSASCWVRLLQVDGQWRPMILLSPHGLTHDLVRTFPMRRVEIAVNASDIVSAKLVARFDEPINDPGSLEFYARFRGFATPEPDPIMLKRPAGRKLDA